MRLAFAVVATLAVVAAACGGVENEPNLERAAERTEEVGSFAFEVTRRTTPPSEFFDISCEGAVDRVPPRARLACDGRMPGAVEWMFIGGSDFYKHASTEGKWWRDIADDESPGADSAPERILKLLHAASQEVERVGDDDVRGEPAVRYALTVDCVRAEIHTCTSDTGVVDVWIDDEGLLRRIAVDEGGRGTTIEYYDFGAPVDVATPPDHEIVELTSEEFRCRPEEARPILVTQTIEVLQRAGFDMKQHHSRCVPGLAASLSNTGSTFDVWGAPSPSHGILTCDVLTNEPGIGGDVGVAFGFTMVNGGPPEPIEERTLENLHCGLFVQGPRANERIDALDAAFAELKREVRG